MWRREVAAATVAPHQTTPMVPSAMSAAMPADDDTSDEREPEAPCGHVPNGVPPYDRLLPLASDDQEGRHWRRRRHQRQEQQWRRRSKLHWHTTWRRSRWRSLRNPAFFVFGSGAPPISDILQKWRHSLASLLFFLIIVTDNFGLTSSSSLNKGNRWSSSSSTSFFASAAEVPRAPLYENSPFPPSTCPCASLVTTGIPVSSCDQCLNHTTAGGLNATAVCKALAMFGDGNDDAGGPIMSGNSFNSRNEATTTSGASALGSGSDFKLQTCPTWPLHHLAPDLVILARDDPAECERVLSRVLLQDCCTGLIAKFYEEVLDRFDWRVHYSYRFKVPHCREAYTMWACSTMLEVKLNNATVPPCTSFCDRVEERCPYFAPRKPLQYAGEPNFFCHDPFIEEDPAVIVPVDETTHPCCYQMTYLDRWQDPSEFLNSAESPLFDDNSACNRTGLLPRRRSEDGSDDDVWFIDVLLFGTDDDNNDDDDDSTGSSTGVGSNSNSSSSSMTADGSMLEDPSSSSDDGEDGGGDDEEDGSWLSALGLA